MQRRFYGPLSLGLLFFFAPPGRAQWRVAPEKIDFGARPQNQVVTAEVTLTNVSAAAATVLSLQSDCGCTTASVGSSRLQPGQSTPVTIRFETGGIEGSVSHVVTVELTGGQIVTIPIAATVYHYLHWILAPARILLPPSPRGADSSALLEATHLGGAPARIISVGSDSPLISVEAQGGGQGRFRYVVKKNPEAPNGSLFATIHLKTGDPASPLLDVPVFAYVTAGVEVRPNPIVVPVSRVGVRRTCAVRVFGWEETGIFRAKLNGGEVLIQERKGNEIVLALSVLSPDPGDFTHHLMLYDGERLVTTVPVTQHVDP